MRSSGLEGRITRRKWWADEATGDAISLAEWSQYVALDPEIQGDRENQAEDFLFLTHSETSIPLWWRRGEVYTKNPDDTTVAKWVQIAKVLGARVLGDDDEIYGVDPADPTKSEAPVKRKKGIGSEAEGAKVKVDVSPVFAAYFARNRGPVPGDPETRQAPDYGVSASLEGATIGLALVFRSGSAYCCYEWSCHLNLYQGKRWGWLRRELTACGFALPAQLELRLEVIVEEGALFFDCSRPEPSRRGRGWYAFGPVEARRYQVGVTEEYGDPAEAGSGDSHGWVD